MNEIKRPKARKTLAELAHGADERRQIPGVLDDLDELRARLSECPESSGHPRRIQRQRTKGWRMPDGAVYVGRPTVFGNPWALKDAAFLWKPGGVDLRQRAAWVVEQYKRDLKHRGFVHYDLSEQPTVQLADLPARLGGRDLACWCPLDMPCHADVLLRLANPREPFDG